MNGNAASLAVLGQALLKGLAGEGLVVAGEIEIDGGEEALALHAAFLDPIAQDGRHAFTKVDGPRFSALRILWRHEQCASGQIQVLYPGFEALGGAKARLQDEANHRVVAKFGPTIVIEYGQELLHFMSRQRDYGVHRFLELLDRLCRVEARRNIAFRRQFAIERAQGANHRIDGEIGFLLSEAIVNVFPDGLHSHISGRYASKLGEPYSYNTRDACVTRLVGLSIDAEYKLP